MRRRTLASDNSENCASRPTLLVKKILRFHSQIHICAEGMPDVMEAPAPRKSACGVFRLTPTDRINASRGRRKSFIKLPPERLLLPWIQQRILPAFVSVVRDR